MRFDATYAPASMMPNRKAERTRAAGVETSERPFRGLFIGMAISGGLWAAILALVF